MEKKNTKKKTFEANCRFYLYSVVMRREQIQKICLNHALTTEIEYTPKDAKSWQFVANDYTDGTLAAEHFCLRFKTDEIAKDFKKAIDDILANKTKVNENAIDHTDTASHANITSEEGQNIASLKLPGNFYDYKTHEDCAGCRGCASDDFVFAEVKDTNFGQIDDNPLPLNPPPKPDISHNDLSKDTKKTGQSNPFSFSSFGSANNSFTFSTTPNANNPQDTGMFFGNSNFKPAFGSGAEKKEANKPAFGQTNMFGGNVTKTTSAEPVKSTPSFSFNTSSGFGGNGMSLIS